MTQLDLPQISLQRYVDLLKRRRWQVIPVSLLGLVVGGIVAFFIPRYFVASATLVYNQLPGDSPTANEDPFADIVDAARLTIPRAIGPTIKKLGWPEGLVTDPFELRENIVAIEARLHVGEENSGKNRKFVRLRVTYKDRDGLRAATFTNLLVETWRNQSIDELTNNANAVRFTATEEHRQQVTAYDKFLRERQHLEETYKIDPSRDVNVQKSESVARNDQLQKLRSDLLAKKTEAVGLEAKLAEQQSRLKDMLPRVPPDGAMLGTQVDANPEVKVRVQLILYWTIAAESHLVPATRARYERRVAKLKEELAKLPGGIEVGEDGKIPNPLYEKLAGEIAAADLAVTTIRGELGVLEKQIEADAKDIGPLAEGYGRYERVVEQLAETKRRRDAAFGAMESATQVLGKLGSEPTVRVENPAQTPPRPTEPNIVLVALLGCVVGLLVATLLVLLLDILQGSFKTVDDVERGLSVPVLGGMSHLETVEERNLLLKSRRRMTLVASSFVILTTGVVLMYYYDPTRLPPFVRDLLALVLGA